MSNPLIDAPKGSVLELGDIGFISKHADPLLTILTGGDKFANGTEIRFGALSILGIRFAVVKINIKDGKVANVQSQ